MAKREADGTAAVVMKGSANSKEGPMSADDSECLFEDSQSTIEDPQFVADSEGTEWKLEITMKKRWHSDDRL